MHAWKRKSSQILFILSAITANSAFAYIYTFGLSPSTQKLGTTQTFFLTPEIEKTYQPEVEDQTILTGEIFIGKVYPISSVFYGQYGYALAVTNAAKLDGTIFDDADPMFNNYSYHYKVQHAYLGFKGKLLMNTGFFFTPWISASIGPGVNRASSFSNTPLTPEAVQNPNFADKTTLTLSYTAGAGLQARLSNSIQVGVGYEYAAWGNADLGKAPGQTLNSGLRLNNLSSSGVLLYITYSPWSRDRYQGY